MAAATDGGVQAVTRMVDRRWQCQRIADKEVAVLSVAINYSPVLFVAKMKNLRKLLTFRDFVGFRWS